MPSHLDHPVLVTGAAGFAGGHLLDLLEREARPAPVVCWRRIGEPLPPPPTGRSCRWIELDILDRRAVDAAIAEVRPAVVYHLAGAAHAGRSWDRAALTLAVNVLGTHHLLTALGRAGDGACVLIPGSALVYRPQDHPLTEADPVGPVSPYGLSKLAQEMAGLGAGADTGLRVIVTRSFNHIGPRQDPSFFASSFARQIALVERGLAEPALHVGNLDARRDLTDVRDTVAAYRLLVEHGRAGGVYNVCSGREFRIGDLLDRLLARSRAQIEVRHDPARDRQSDVPLILGDSSRLQRETGWSPRIGMDETLDDLLAYWRATAPTAAAP